MANINPIQVNKPFRETEFLIPKKYNKTMIYISLKIELEKEGWLYASAHSIFLSGSDLYPAKTPEPVDLKTNYGELLDGERLGILSHVSRIKEQSDSDTPPVIKYNLTIEAGDILLDSFDAKSGTENPTDFKSLIIFKIEK